MPGDTEVEDYEPDDRGWGVVAGGFMPKPVEEDDASQSEAEAEDRE
jgi:hypothetical protein